MEQLDPRLASALGSILRARSAVALKADAEIGLELAADVAPDAERDAALEAVAGYGAALEFVDLGAPGGGPEEVVAANVYRRAFVLGPLDRSCPVAGVDVSLIVNGEARASGAAGQDIAELVCPGRASRLHGRATFGPATA